MLYCTVAMHFMTPPPPPELCYTTGDSDNTFPDGLVEVPYGPTSAKTRLRVKIIFLRKMMFCKTVVSRGRSSAVKWNQRESRLFEEVAVMAGRVSAVREVKGLPVEYSLLLL